MARFLRLGSYWLSCFAWLVVVSTSLADFGSADRTALVSCQLSLNTIRNILDFATIRDSGTELNVYDYGTHYKLNEILTVLQSYTAIDYSSTLDSIDSTLSNTDETVTDIKDTLEDIYDSFGGITNSINKWGLSVSNAIANLQISGGTPAVYTNLPSLLAQIVYDDYIYDYNSLAEDILTNLTGSRPSLEQINQFSYLLQEYGVTQRFWQDKLSLYGYPSDGDSMDTIYDWLTGRVYYDTYDPQLAELGELYYYEYGTRPLIDYFAQATNDYVLANADVVTVDDNGRASFSQRFVSSVGSLASSFAPSVNTNIATVATNDIVNIEDDGYASKYEEIIEYDPSENGTDDILSYVNDVSIIEDFTSALSDSGEVSFSFDLPALGSTQNIVVQVDDVTSYTGAFFEVMFGFLKFVAFSVMAYKCWEIVVDVHFQKLR